MDSANTTVLEEKVAGLPVEPGVYLFKNDRGAVLYVGKAQNLRNRVRQYPVSECSVFILFNFFV